MNEQEGGDVYYESKSVNIVYNIVQYKVMYIGFISKCTKREYTVANVNMKPWEHH